MFTPILVLVCYLLLVPPIAVFIHGLLLTVSREKDSGLTPAVQRVAGKASRWVAVAALLWPVTLPLAYVLLVFVGASIARGAYDRLS